MVDVHARNPQNASRSGKMFQPSAREAGKKQNSSLAPENGIGENKANNGL
jgi:hypothetical protein